MKLDGRKRYFRIDIIRLDGQRAIQNGCLFTIASENSVTDRDLLQREKVTRVEINRALKVSCGFFPASLTPLDVTRQLEYPWIIGQSLAGDFQFSQGTAIIEISPIKILRTREACFACIRAKAKCRLNGCFCQGQPCRSMVEAKEVKQVMSMGDLAVRLEK